MIWQMAYVFPLKSIISTIEEKKRKERICTYRDHFSLKPFWQEQAG